jgi:thermitase
MTYKGKILFLTGCFLLTFFLSCFHSAGVSAFEQAIVDHDEILIQFKKDAGLQIDQKAVLSVDGIRLKILDYFPGNNIFLARKPENISLKNFLEQVKKFDDVELAEPNYVRYIQSIIPNDPFYDQQWALKNIQADMAWTKTKGKSSVVVAIADTGIDYYHEDLRSNLWKNPGEVCGNGIDDNNDGYIDNCYGINAVNNSGDPWDDEGHGTHVAGIIGAVGNNLKGIAGTNWNVSLMALKFIGPDGLGKVSDLIKCIEFAMEKNVRIFNMSFGSYQFSEFEKAAIENAHNILFIASAGNESRNNNTNPLYPASYDLPNIISVAASNQSDSLAVFSNYGSGSVSLAAPGTNILSTQPDDQYQAFSGTSMSAAYVSGAAGLVLARHSNLGATGLKDRILRTVDVIPVLQEKVITGGRLNAYRALAESVTGPYIFNIQPGRARIGSKITIQGADFGNFPGKVLFTGVQAQTIISWRKDEIACQVPEGAVTGPVQVVTRSNQRSNQVQFEVSTLPEAQRFSFASASTKAGENYFLILLNIFENQVKVYTKVVGSSGDIVYKVYTLDPYERRIINPVDFLIHDDDLFINLESDDFFGAAMLKFSPDMSRVYPFYFNPWGPSIIEEFGGWR